jgi:hypothetical protein
VKECRRLHKEENMEIQSGVLELRKKPLKDKLAALEAIIKERGEGETVAVILSRKDAEKVFISASAVAIDAYF